MGHLIKNTILRRSIKTLLGILIFILAIPVLLYVPPIQRLVVDFALKEVNKSSDMKIGVESFHLSWPLDVTLKGLTVIEASGDTMVSAGSATVNVEVLPLLKLDIHADARLRDVKYRLGGPDSLMFLTASVDEFILAPSSYNLATSDVTISKAELNGGDVNLRFNGTDTTATPVDTAAAMAMIIKADDIVLRKIRYAMTMMPTIDSLGVDIAEASLKNGIVDMGARRIHATSLAIDSVAATYLTPSAEYLAANPVEETPVDTVVTPVDQMWVITGDSLRLTGRNAVYAMRGAVPQPGLDMNYIEASNILIAVDSFYNRGAEITVPLRSFKATERCGVKLDASGRFSMDSTMMRAENFDISTLFSSIKFSAEMGMGDMVSDPGLPIGLDAIASIGVPDLEMIMPTMQPVLKSVPRYNDLKLEADVNGTIGDINLENISLSLPGYVGMAASGNVANAMDPDKLNGDVEISGKITNVNFLKPTLLDVKMAKQVNIPPTALNGNVRMRDGVIAGDLKAVTGKGNVLLDAMFNGKAEVYSLDMALNEFPVNSILTEMGIGKITAKAAVKGKGYDPYSDRTSINADIDLASLEYQGELYTDIKATAALDKGLMNASLSSLNKNADMDVTITGTMAPDDIDMKFNGSVRNLDLQGLKMSETMSKGKFDIDGHGRFMPSRNVYDADIAINNIYWAMSDMEIATPQVALTLDATDSLTSAKLVNESLTAEFVAHQGIDSIASKFGAAMELLDRDIANKHIDVDSLQHALPGFALDINCGSNSVISDFLSPSNASIGDFRFMARNDSLISLNGYAHNIAFGETRIDTVAISALQHGKFLVYRMEMNNRPGVFDEFAHVDVSGFLAKENLSLFVTQSNIKNETGYKLGFNVTAVDSVLSFHMVPLKPIIGYKTWSLNSDNFIKLNMDSKHLDADLALENENSLLKIYTEHDGHDSDARHQEDIIVKASGINLADWLSLSPFAPPINGVAGADISIGWNPVAGSIDGNGKVSLDNLTYGKDRVGSFLLDVGLSTNAAGVVRASTSLLVDTVKVITATGALNDSAAENPFMLDFSMIHFPLKIVNPFLPEGVAKLSGMLNGEMDITGTLAKPVFNGFIDFDSASVFVDMIGTAIKFSDEKIPVDSNVVKFDNYSIMGKNANPLLINGTVDVNDMASPKIDLAANAENMQIIDSKKSKGSDVYGKAFIDVDATVKGNLDFMRVNATLNLLEGSDVTYVMSTAANTITQGVSDDDMVKFVQFSDTASVNKVDTISNSGMAMMLNARLIVSEGTTLNVDISSNGKDKAQIKGSGSLTFAMTPFSDGTLTGRYNISSGFVRYTPPLMSQKLFEFIDNSYVAFTGDMMNPTLNIHARETIKANVTEEGQDSRLVNFLITLNVTNTLENMNVSFDLGTNDDISIQNELETMSPEQRANQAMNLLLYNVYTGPGTKASANLSGNPLFSFLSSQLNSWAANNIKGVDISFGIDQYDRVSDGATSTTTSYSYKVSKTLFNDRVKIVVGGNYSTDSDMDENFSENLINDISFEYMLNRSGSMYVRLFRHIGYESILEGEVIQTGVGFVYKRKMTHFKDLFRLPGRRKKSQPVKQAVEANVNEVKTEDNVSAE